MGETAGLSMGIPIPHTSRLDYAQRPFGPTHNHAQSAGKTGNNIRPGAPLTVSPAARDDDDDAAAAVVPVGFILVVATVGIVEPTTLEMVGVTAFGAGVLVVRTRVAMGLDVKELGIIALDIMAPDIMESVIMALDIMESDIMEPAIVELVARALDEAEVPSVRVLPGVPGPSSGRHQHQC